MKKLPRATWISRYDDTDIQANTAFNQIGHVLNIIGKWNYSHKVLDVQAGIGVMVQLLNDNGYNAIGTEVDEVSEFWENKDELVRTEPIELPFDDGEFNLVTWFSMHEDRVEESYQEEVIEEMVRVSNKYIIVKPYNTFEPVKDKEFLSFMLSKRMRVINFVPKLLYYVLTKG